MFKSIKKVKFLVILTFILIISLFYGCSSDSNEKNNADENGIDEIDISVTHYPTGAYAVPYNVGIEKGIFEDYDIKINDIAGSSGGGTTVRNVLSGDLPFGDVATSATIQAFLSGAPIQIIGGAVQSPADLVYVSRDEGEFKNLEDLVGHTWSFTSPGSVTESVSQLIFDKENIDPNDMEIVASGGVSEGLTMLEADEVDAAIMLEPTYSTEKDKWQELFRVSEYLENYQQTVIVTSPQIMEEDPDLVKRYLKAYQESVEYIHENPDESAKIFAENAEIDEEASIDAVNDLVEANHWDTEIELDSMLNAIKGMELVELISEDEEVDWDDLFNLDALDDDKKFDYTELK